MSWNLRRAALAAIFCGVVAAGSSANAALIAYWDQNSNALSGGGFGFEPASFPQAADQGAGSLSLAGFDATTLGSGAYQYVQSFAGTTTNAQPMIASGGSLAPQGGLNNSSNGMRILLNVSTLGFEDIQVSWAQQRTSTGFNSTEFLYSTDGVNFTSFDTDTAIPSSFGLKSQDLSAVAAIENAPSVTFALLLTGATNASGNNRFDNITIEGTPAIPEPAAIALLGLCFAGVIGLRYRLG